LFGLQNYKINRNAQIFYLDLTVRAARAERWDGWECEPHGQRCETGGSASCTGRDVRWVGVRAAWAEMWDKWDGWDRWDGRVLIKNLAIEKKILPLLKVKNILYRKNEYRATTSIKWNIKQLYLFF